MSAETAVEICNLALRRVGAKAITTLATGGATVEERVCFDLFDDVLEDFLTLYRWRFCMAWASLDATTGGSGTYATPNHEFNYEFGLPADFLSLHGFYGQVGSYAIVGKSAVYTNTTEIAISYVKKYETYSDWNRATIAAFSSYLATQIAVPLGQKKMLPTLEAQYARALVAAIRSETDQSYNVDSDTESDDLWSQEGR